MNGKSTTANNPENADNKNKNSIKVSDSNILFITVKKSPSKPETDFKPMQKPAMAQKTNKPNTIKRNFA